MVDLKVLEKFGVSAALWKEKLNTVGREHDGTALRSSGPFEARPQDEKLRGLRERIRSRISVARDYNLANWQSYHTLDLVWDSAYRQITPTLLSTLSSSFKSKEESLSVLKAYGMDLTKLMIESSDKDNKTSGSGATELNLPVFFDVAVPLVRGYLQIRRAKIINDRNVRPLLKYTAAANTPENRLKAEVITDRVDVAASMFDYLGTIDQATLQMLLYGWSIILPRESWFSEEQLRFKEKGSNRTDAKPDLADDDPRKEEFERYVTKEGVRYHVPHPTRSYYDQAFSRKTLNTDTGGCYVGCWKVVRFRDLKNNPEFYNLDRVNMGNNEWWGGTNGSSFFNTVYPCRIKFPALSSFQVPDNKQREEWMANNAFYSAEYDDNAVVYFDHFEKIIPKDEGLGDYPYPIWARFSVAGDGTIIFAEPLAYSPPIVLQDNGDDNRLEDASQGMMLAPFQDQIRNLVTQYLLSVKQNLTNLTFVDENVVDKTWIDKLRNLGERMWRTLNIFPYDGRKYQKSQYGVGQAVVSHRFPPMNTTEIMQCIREVLGLAERVLQFSSQEVAQAASHEQTVPEIQMIAHSTSHILSYTAIPVDRAMQAMGRQQYEAIMNYGEDDFFVHVPNEDKLTTKNLKEMGLTVLTEPKKPGDKMLARADKKTAMKLDWFAVVPNIHERPVDTKVAQDMAIFFQNVLSNPMIAAAIGPEQAVMIANAIAKMAGIPLPEPIKNTGQTPETQQQQSQEMLQGVIAQVLQQVKEGIQPILEATKVNEMKVDALYKMLNLPEPNVTGGPNDGDIPVNPGNPEMVATA